MKNILIPTDFSTTAQTAANFAISIFGTEEINYHLLNCYEEPHTSAEMLVSIRDLLSKDSLEGLASESKRLLDSHPSLQGYVHTSSKYGSVNLGIEALYKDIQYDVLINYIKGEIDRKGYNPPYNYSILIDNNDNRITCLDYKQLDVK